MPRGTIEAGAGQPLKSTPFTPEAAVLVSGDTLTFRDEIPNPALNAARVSDILAGGSGNDQFVFTDGSGADTIVDFEAAGAVDVVQLSANINGTGIATFDDIVTRLSDDTVSIAVLDLGGRNTVTLVRVHLSSLATDDFIFG